MKENLEKHKWMMTNPAEWPQYPFLPLKRLAKGRVDLGVVHKDNLTRVVDKLLFALPKTVDEWNAAHAWTYKSVDEMIADGWRVD